MLRLNWLIGLIPKYKNLWEQLFKIIVVVFNVLTIFSYTEDNNDRLEAGVNFANEVTLSAKDSNELFLVLGIILIVLNFILLLNQFPVSVPAFKMGFKKTLKMKKKKFPKVTVDLRR